MTDLGLWLLFYNVIIFFIGIFWYSHKLSFYVNDFIFKQSTFNWHLNKWMKELVPHFCAVSSGMPTRTLAASLQFCSSSYILAKCCLISATCNNNIALSIITVIIKRGTHNVQHMYNSHRYRLVMLAVFASAGQRICNMSDFHRDYTYNISSQSYN